MDVHEAADTITALWGPSMPTMVALRGAKWPQLLAWVPPPAVDKAMKGRLPGMALVTLVRGTLANKGAMADAAAVSVWLSQRLDERIGEDHPDALVERAAAGGWLMKAGDLDAAGRLLGSAWRGLRHMGEDRRLAAVGDRWSAWLMARERHDEAEEVLEVVWRHQRRQGGGAGISARLGQVRLARGDVEGALPLLRSAWEQSASRPWRLGVGRALGRALVRQSLHSQAVTVLRMVVEEEHRDEAAADASMLLATALEAQQHPDEALRMVELAVQTTREMDAAHPTLAHRLSVWARMAFTRGHRTEAEGLLREAVDLDESRYGNDSPEVARRYAELGRLVLALGREEEALGWLEPATGLLRRHLGEEAELTRQTAEAMAAGLMGCAEGAARQGDKDLALYYADRVLGLAGVLVPMENSAVRKAKRVLGY